MFYVPLTYVPDYFSIKLLIFLHIDIIPNVGLINKERECEELTCDRTGVGINSYQKVLNCPAVSNNELRPVYTDKAYRPIKQHLQNLMEYDRAQIVGCMRPGTSCPKTCVDILLKCGVR